MQLADEIPTDVGEIVTKINAKRRPLSHTHEKYVDDLTIAESINPKVQVKLSGDSNPTRPIPYHHRTGHVLPYEQSIVCQEMTKLGEYAAQHEMRINKKKTKMILFNQSKTFDFQPEISIENDPIEMIEESKLLGVILTSDLKWRKNNQCLTERGYSRLWLIKRLQKLNCPTEDLPMLSK